MKSSDIPGQLNQGKADIGFVGSDKLDEANLANRWLNMSRYAIADAGCTLVAAGKMKGDVIKPGDTIATSYPFLAGQWLSKKTMKNDIVVQPSGSVEAYVDLGIADAIVDIRETGRTLEQNNLPFFEKIREITTDMIWRDTEKPLEQELDVSRLYAALGRIAARKIPPYSWPEKIVLTDKTVTEVLFNSPNELVKKMGSETAEWIQDYVNQSADGLVGETQDVLFAMAVGLAARDRSLIQALNRL